MVIDFAGGAGGGDSFLGNFIGDFSFFGNFMGDVPILLWKSTFGLGIVRVLRVEGRLRVVGGIVPPVLPPGEGKFSLAYFSCINSNTRGYLSRI